MLRPRNFEKELFSRNHWPGTLYRILCKKIAKNPNDIFSPKEEKEQQNRKVGKGRFVTGKSLN